MKRSNRSMIGMFLLAALAACSNPADNTPRAVVSSAATPVAGQLNSEAVACQWPGSRCRSRRARR